MNIPSVNNANIHFPLFCTVIFHIVNSCMLLIGLTASLNLVVMLANHQQGRCYAAVINALASIADVAQFEFSWR